MIPVPGSGGLLVDLGPATALVVLGLFASSFFFSGTETAYFALQKPDQDRFARGTPGERRVVKLLDRRAALITTILLGNELSNIALAATSAAVIGHFGPSWLNVVVLTPLLVLFSEITPKVLAFRFRRRWAPWVVWPFTVWFVIATPVRWVVSGLLMGIGKLLGVEDRRESIAAEELMVYVAHGAAIGELDPLERDIIESVFEFDDLTVQRLMTPRPDVFSVPITIGWQELLDKCREEGLSRIPVTGHDQDDIIGILLLKDLLKFRATPLSGPRQLRSLLLPPVFVPASKSADGMLREFLEKRFHMALVVDEHGTFVGLVTLDDLLGELIGAEDDSTEDAEIAGPPDGMTVKASIDLQDFEEETQIAIPEGDYHTLGGFVFHVLGRLPRRGESVTFGDHRYQVSKMEGRRVSEILVTPVLPASEGTDQEAM
ncbi:MAG: hemolysin family protein [Myxococcota bacterium]